MRGGGVARPRRLAPAAPVRTPRRAAAGRPMSRSLGSAGVVLSARLADPDAVVRQHDRFLLPDGPARARSPHLPPRRCVRDGVRLRARARAVQRPRRFHFIDDRARSCGPTPTGSTTSAGRTSTPWPRPSSARRRVARWSVSASTAAWRSRVSTVGDWRAAAPALGPVTPEAWAAQTALEAGAHDEALTLVD